MSSFSWPPNEGAGDITGPNSSTDNALPRFNGTTGKSLQASSVIVDDSDNITGVNDLTVGGDLTVSGTTTTVNTATLDVEDANITVNNSGNQATANTNVAGITVEMSDATDARLGYDSSTTSKWKAGESGSEAEIATTSHSQTLTNKSVDADNNTITNLVNSSIKAAAAIALNKLAALTGSRAIVSDGSGFLSAATTTATEIGYVNGVTSSIQTQIDGKEDTVTGAATSITGADLTASRAVVSNGSGKVAAASTTSTEIGYVSGVTSAIQTQINNKQADVVTTRGDVIRGSSGGAAERLAIGANGTVLTSDGTDVSWAAPVAGEYQAKSANYTVTDSDNARVLDVTAGSTSFDFVDGDVSTGDDSITETSHGLSDGDAVHLTTTGELPAGLSPNTTYFIVSSTTNTFDLALTSGGSSIDITAAAGGGTHTVHVGVVITLPTASANTNRLLSVRKADNTVNRVVVDGEGAETINGDTHLSLATINSSIEVTGTGSAWVTKSRVPKKFTVGYLDANVTANGSLFSMTTVVGRIYELHAQFQIGGNSGTDDMDVQIKDGSVFLGEIEEVNIGNVTTTRTFSTIYRATDTTLNFSFNENAGSCRVNGDGTKRETHAVLIDVTDDYIEVDSF